MYVQTLRILKHIIKPFRVTVTLMRHDERYCAADDRKVTYCHVFLVIQQQTTEARRFLQYFVLECCKNEHNTAEKATICKVNNLARTELAGSCIFLTTHRGYIGVTKVER